MNNTILLYRLSPLRAAFAFDLLPHEKAQASAGNEGRHREDYHRVAVIGGQAPDLISPKNIKPGVTERRHRSEHALPDGSYPIPGPEAGRQNHRARSLKDKGGFERPYDQMGDIAGVVQVEAGRCRQSLAQGQLLFHQ